MSYTNEYDVVIIGGGPGGYVAAIRAAQLKKRVAIVEKAALGGICLNWGCIPTKTLLRNAEVLHLVKNAHRFGINIPEYSPDFTSTIKRSRSVANRLSKGIEFLMKKNKVTCFTGRGVIKNPGNVEVITGNGVNRTISTDNILIATGARNRVLRGMEPDGKRIISYREAMVLDNIPKRLIIIGGGSIGVEFASMYREFGSDVHIIEMLPRILPNEDAEITTVLEASLKKQGIKINTSSKVNRIESSNVSVSIYISHNEKSEIIDGDIALVAVGFSGNVENIGLETIGVEENKGWIKTGESYKTSVDGIYAIGDVIGPPWLAHVASAEGKKAVEHMFGLNPEPLDYSNIPGCVYCRPQVASVGLTEFDAIQQGFDIKVGRFPFRAAGKALAAAESDGFVKIVYDTKDGSLIGCHIVGMDATEIIAEAVVAKKMGATAEDMLSLVHAHPTLSEAIWEATADAYGKAIHI